MDIDHGQVYVPTVRSWIIVGVLFAVCGVTFLGIAAGEFSGFSSVRGEMPDWFTGLLFGIFSMIFGGYIAIKPKRVEVTEKLVRVVRLVGNSEHPRDSAQVEVKNLESSLGRGSEFILVRSSTGRWPSVIPLRSFDRANRPALRDSLIPAEPPA